jgi:hypothetical protein
MTTFALWLTDPGTSSVGITQQNMQPPRFPTVIEADWLWSFLQKKKDKKPLLDRANGIADLSNDGKIVLKNWIKKTSQLAIQFQPSPPMTWPITRPDIDSKAWTDFKTLMEAFYEKGLRSGLPYRADGKSVESGGVSYKEFVKTFLDEHQMNANPAAKKVCVLCGGPLEEPEVDHWIAKGAFPLLSVCADNLLPICSTCNSTSNKGEKPVYNNGCFDDWFHPYHRHANGSLDLEYVLKDMKVDCKAGQPVDQQKVINLDGLLNLSSRWTREFKAEYANHQDILRQREQNRIRKGANRHTQDDIQHYIQVWKEDLVPTKPHYEVHSLLSDALLEPARLAAWATELSDL